MLDVCIRSLKLNEHYDVGSGGGGGAGGFQLIIAWLLLVAWGVQFCGLNVATPCVSSAIL